MPGVKILGNMSVLYDKDGNPCLEYMPLDLLGSSQTQQDTSGAGRADTSISAGSTGTSPPVTLTRTPIVQSHVNVLKSSAVPINAISNGLYLSGDVGTQYRDGAWINYTPEIVTDISDQVVTNMGLPYEETFPLPHTWPGGFREFFFRDTGAIYLRTSEVLSLNTFKELRFTFTNEVYPALGTAFVQLRNYSSSWWTPTVTFNQSDILLMLSTYGELTFKISGGSSNTTFPTVILEKVEVVT